MPATQNDEHDRPGRIEQPPDYRGLARGLRWNNHLAPFEGWLARLVGLLIFEGQGGQLSCDLQASDGADPQ